MTSLSAAICAALETGDPLAKALAARKVARDWRLGRLAFAFDCEMPDRPARPERPELLPPNRMPKRGRGGSTRSRIALWHSIAHIEFVAIDLALDMAGRFGGEMGAAFTSDFLKVAADEASHFMMISRHLRTMGAAYGDLPAHDGLWESAQNTAHDVAARLAVVPMVLEARGLDATPMMIERMRAFGDERGAKLLERILDDEIDHVRCGATHFAGLASARRIDAHEMWISLVSRYFGGRVKPPFNDSARIKAGLSRHAYGALALDKIDT